MKKHYIYITPFFPSPGSWRGSYCLDFVKALIRTKKYEVSVFVPGDGEDYETDGVAVHRFPFLAIPSNIFPFLFDRRNTANFLNALRRAAISHADVAVCHANTAVLAPYPLALKRLNQECLTLLHHHDLQSFGLNNGILSHFTPYNLLQYPILRRMHEAVDCHVFVSKTVEESFRRAPDASWTSCSHYRKQMRLLGLYRSPRIKRGLVLHNGVDTTLFRPDGAPCHASPRDTFTIGCIGNFNELKGQDDLIRALAIAGPKLGNWKLRIIGSGNTFGKFRALAAETGLEGRIEVLPEVRHEELPEFYRGLDLFVLPSWFEGFGCVFTEAWACGVPFITCEGQGMDDMIPREDRAKWLCRPRNPADLADKILSFHKERTEQKLSSEIDIDVLVARFLSQIEEI